MDGEMSDYYTYRPCNNAADALVYLDFMGRYATDRQTGQNFQGIAKVIRSLTQRIGEQASFLEKSEAGSVTWLDISTAPKDGTEILLATWQAGVWIVLNGYYDDGNDLPTTKAIDRETAIGWWYYKNCMTQEKMDDIYEPTHWCPMAAAPKERP